MDDPDDSGSPGGGSPSLHPVATHWEHVLEDMEATAEQYREAGRETVELHPGDVTVLVGEPGPPDGEIEASDPRDLGLDVLVPGGEYDRLHARVAERAFDSYEVFRRVDSGVVFLLIVLEDDADEVAVFVPAYYEAGDRDDLRGAIAAAGGTLYTHVRKLSGEDVITFEHDDPDPFFPDDGELEPTE